MSSDVERALNQVLFLNDLCEQQGLPTVCVADLLTDLNEMHDSEIYQDMTPTLQKRETLRLIAWYHKYLHETLYMYPSAR